MSKKNVNFILVTTADREILSEGFETFGQAWEQMKTEMIEAGVPEEAFAGVTEAEEPGEWGFSAHECRAYCNGRSDFDWAILDVDGLGFVDDEDKPEVAYKVKVGVIYYYSSGTETMDFSVFDGALFDTFDLAFDAAVKEANRWRIGMNRSSEVGVRYDMVADKDRKSIKLLRNKAGSCDDAVKDGTLVYDFYFWKVF